MISLGAITSFATHLLGELVGPSRCAACDEVLPLDRLPRVLFCPPCAASVERADRKASAPKERAAFEYGGAIATAIARFKYEDRADLGPRLGLGMVQAAASLKGAVDMVVPVPLHPKRLAERGYNQAALLARPVARSLHVPLVARALGRCIDTPRQATLDRGERLRNVAHAFVTRAKADICTARVLLVDDVRTTGATIQACTAALNEAGARSVVALVLARRA